MSLKKSLNRIKDSLTKTLKTIGIIQSTILLGLFYFLVLGPTSILYRISKIFSKQPKQTKSFWIKRDNQPVTDENLQKQF